MTESPNPEKKDYYEHQVDLPHNAADYKEPFSAVKHDGPARLWFNYSLVSGIVCSEPRSWGKSAFLDKQFRHCCVFRIGLKSGRWANGYIPVWCYSKLAPRVLTTVHKSDQVMVHGAIVSRTFRHSKTGSTTTQVGLRATTVLRIPDRTENYYREECVAVPRDELMRLREIERKHALAQYDDPDQLLDLVQHIGANPLTDQQLEATMQAMKELSEGAY